MPALLPPRTPYGLGYPRLPPGTLPLIASTPSQGFISNSGGVTVDASSTVATQTVAVAAPARIQVGDLLVGFFYGALASTSYTYTAPAGWSSAGNSQSIATTAGVLSLFYKVADATDVGAASFTFTASRVGNNQFFLSASVSVYRGFTGFDLAGFQVNASSTTPGTPSVAATASGDLVVHVLGTFSGNAFVSAPTGSIFEGQYRSATNVGLMTADSIRVGSGATGAGTFTITPADTSVSAQIAFMVSPSSTPPQNYAYTIDDSVGLADPDVAAAAATLGQGLRLRGGSGNALRGNRPLRAGVPVGGAFFSVTVNDPAGLVDGQASAVGRGVTDVAGTTDAAALTAAWARQVDDPTGLVDGQALAVGRQADDGSGLTDATSSGLVYSQALTDLAGLSDTQALGVGLGVTDGAGGVDGQALDVARGLTDPAGLVDGATTSGDWRRTVDDPIGPLDGTALAVGRQVDDQAGSTDTWQMAATWAPVVSDNAGITDTAVAAKSGSAALTVDDPAGLADATALDVARVVADSTGSTDAIAAGLVVSRQVDDPTGLVDGQGLTVGRVVSDQLPATDTAATAAAYSVTATDPAGLTDVASLAASLAVTDPAGLTDGAAAAHGYGVLVTDPAGLVDVLTLAAAWSQALTDAAGVTDTTATAYARIVDDLLAAADDLTLFAGLLDQPIRVTLAAAAVTAPYRQALAVAGATSSSSVQ